MRFTRLTLVTAALVATGPAVSAPTARTPLETLFTGIDYLPTVEDLVAAGSDVGAVTAIASDDGADPGIRIRAFRSLGVYDSPSAKAMLTQTLTALRESPEPLDRLYLIAAAEALGEHGGEAAVPDLAALLDHESRDVRAAAASALGRTQAPAACDRLTAQLTIEDTDQVAAAVNAALTSLGAACQVGH